MLRGELQLFAPCPRGLEAALADELKALGASACRITGGGVAFAGDAVLAMAANLHSRIASRILMQVAWGRCRDEDSLYRLVRGVEWERWFNQRVTLRVDVSAHRSPLRSLNFATLRVKDAICDRFRESTGVRPSIDTRSPDVRVFAYLDEIDATIYLDLSGESLFKRGWRGAEDSSGAAPLKENLAAGLLTLAGWQPSVPLHDPLCGSGTLLIEAAQRALGIAPGRHRRFGFEKLRGFDALVLADLKQDIDRTADAARPAGEALQISGSDIDPRAIERTRRNLERAGIPEGLVSLRVEDFGAATTRATAPGAQGILLTNPPYGERLFARAHSGTDMTEADEPVGARPRASGDRQGFVSAERKLTAEPRAPAEPRALAEPHALAEPRALAEPHDDAAHQLAMQRIGARLRRDYGGWRACVLSPDPQLPRQLGMQPKRRIPLFNGAIECRLFCFEIFERSARETHAAA